MQTSEIIKSCTLFAIAQTAVWFQLYSHYIWDWWKDKPLVSALVFGVPASILFWYGTRIAVDATNEAWVSRMLGFGMSYFTFPLLTWWLLNESMFTAKTMLCVFLSFVIVGIQLFWR